MPLSGDEVSGGRFCTTFWPLSKSKATITMSSDHSVVALRNWVKVDSEILLSKHSLSVRCY